MMISAHALAKTLQAQGLWQTPVDAPTAPAWYVTALQGSAAWLAALLLLPFLAWLLANANLLDSQLSLAVATVVLTVLTGLLLKVGAGRPFQVQLASALALAVGVLALFWAWDQSQGWLLPLVVGLALYVTGPAFVPRLLNALTLAAALCLALQPSVLLFGEILLGPVPLAVLAWIMLFAWMASNSRRRPWLHNLCTPLAWAFLLSSAVIVALDQTADVLLQRQDNLVWIRVAQLAVAVLPMVAWGWVWASTPVALRPGVGLGAGVMLALLILVPTGLAAPGVALALTCLIVGFALSRILLMGVSVIALLAYLGRYYYLLDVPLLQKAGWLAVAGGVLGGCAACLAFGLRRRS